MYQNPFYHCPFFASTKRRGRQHDSYCSESQKQALAATYHRIRSPDCRKALPQNAARNGIRFRKGRIHVPLHILSYSRSRVPSGIPVLSPSDGTAVSAALSAHSHIQGFRYPPGHFGYSSIKTAKLSNSSYSHLLFVIPYPMQKGAGRSLIFSVFSKFLF